MGEMISLAVLPATDRFELFSIEPDLIQAFEQDGKKKFKGIASSTTKDLHGDTITLEALKDMEQQAVGLTMFLNHSYNVPDDVGGTITKAIVRQKGVDQNGDPNYQLEIEGEVEDDNPQALKTWAYVKKGRRLGLSIGAMIPQGGATRNKDGSLTIVRLQLLEVSFVGIPANPKSWIEYAASAIRQIIAKAESHTLGNPVITFSNGRYVIEGSLEGLDINLGAEPSGDDPLSTEHVFDADLLDETKTRISLTAHYADHDDTTVLGSWDLADADDKTAAIAMAGEDAVIKATVWVETRDGDTITIGEPPESTKSADIEPEITDDAAPEPDVQDAKIRIIEVDTDDPSSDGGSSQGASSSEPDDADETYAAPEADVTAALGEELILDEQAGDKLLKLSFDQLKAVAVVAVNQLVAANKALDEEKALRIAAEAQTEEVATVAAELVQRTAKIIEKVANAPLPRKAVLKGIEAEFSASVEAFYGTEFARALAGKK